MLAVTPWAAIHSWNCAKQSVGQWMSGKVVARKQATLLAKLQGVPQPSPQSTDAAPAANESSAKALLHNYLLNNYFCF